MSSKSVTLGAIQAIPARKTRRRSVPLLVTGIAFTVAGGFSAALFGLAVLMPASGTCHSGDACKPDSTMVLVGGLGALVGFGVGIPLIVYGKQRVPAHSHRSRLSAAPWATAHSGGLSLSGNF